MTFKSMDRYDAKGRKSLRVFAVACSSFFIALLGICSQRGIKNAASHSSTDIIGVAPSLLFRVIDGFSYEHPNISSVELAEHANAQLKELGLDYDFEVSHFIEKHGLRPATVLDHDLDAESGEASYVVTLKLVDGTPRKFLIRVGSAGPCGERIASLPVLSVGPREIVLVANREQYKIQRPSEFATDGMELVDESMQRPIHSWEVPYGAMPVGVSPDGRTLFIDGLLPYGANELGLALSDSGFRLEPLPRDAREFPGAWIQDHPTDRNNAYLSFMRFLVNGKSMIIRFSAPCT